MCSTTKELKWDEGEIPTPNNTFFDFHQGKLQL